MNGELGKGIPETAKNQSSIDRVNNLSDSVEERQAIFDEGLNAAKAQDLSVDETNITAKLDEIRLGKQSGNGEYEYRSFTSKSDAVKFLKANSDWFAADGVYHGSGEISIYATATSSGTLLSSPPGSLLSSRFKFGLSFNRRLTGVENVLQTISHETGHFKGLSHSDLSLYDREYLAVKKYRSRQ